MSLALFCVINPVLGLNPFESGLNITEFLLLFISTTFIAIAGYMQNDLFDINPDSVNKPGKNLVGRKFRVYIIQILYWVFNIIGILAGVLFSFLLGKINYSLIFLFSAGLLWFYSERYQCQPLVVVLIAVYMMLRYFLKENARQFDFLRNEQDLQRLKLSVDKKINSDKIIIAHKLQAYERMALFLERISPPNLITRSIIPGQKAKDLQMQLLRIIREEYEHNLSQQIYISSSSWELIKTAKEEVSGLINSSMDAEMIDKDAGTYAQQILTKGIEKDSIEKAMQSLKSELKDL